MPLSPQSSWKRLLQAEQLLRDFPTKDNSPPARVVAAFDAIYLCCLDVCEFTSSAERYEVHPNPDVVLAVADLLAASAEKIGLPAAGNDLILRLMQWSFFGVEADMPCTPEQAIDLAEQVARRTRSLRSDGQSDAAIRH